MKVSGENFFKLIGIKWSPSSLKRLTGLYAHVKFMVQKVGRLLGGRGIRSHVWEPSLSTLRFCRSTNSRRRSFCCVKYEMSLKYTGYQNFKIKIFNRMLFLMIDNTIKLIIININIISTVNVISKDGD